MKIGYSYTLVAVLAVSLGYFALLDLGLFPVAGTYQYMAGIFFAERVSPDVLKSEYASDSLKVLIVPGHEKDTGGTEYKNITERDLVLKIGEYLQDELSQDTHLTSQLLRSGDGDFADWFKDYIARNSIGVKVFRQTARDTTDAGIAAGQFTPVTKVDHNTAPTATALLLYGVNKYANENKINLVLHLHINDYPRRQTSKPGKYQGFAIYIPESQLPNTRASKNIGASIAKELALVMPASNYKKEQPELVEDQELIAVGANGSRDGASLLIEYGYIYEKKYTDPALREKALKDLALATYLGIENYFNSKVALSVKLPAFQQ